MPFQESSVPGFAKSKLPISRLDFLGSCASSVYTRRMEPKPEELVVLTEVPPGMLDDLPSEDKQAIVEIVGKPIALKGYDDEGRAELEFIDREGISHVILVAPRFIRAVERTDSP